MNEKVLEIQDLSVIFDTDGGRICALRDLSLTIDRGEILVVVGESGCGKSVLCKAIMGLLPRPAEITGGTILLSGRDTTHLTDRKHCALRGTDISMVFQDPMTSLDPTYTIGAQIVEAITVHGKDLSPADTRRKAIALMEDVGIDRAPLRFDSYPWMLSGGMRQRAVLAMALSQNSNLLIADEPTTALDATVQSEILDLLVKRKNEKNMSILFITHDLGVVARVADRVAVMYGGKIVETGTAADIYASPVHPYTWGLLHALPAFAEGERLFPIPGSPPNIPEGFNGDAFAVRNRNALAIDYVETPPLFEISETHKAATWLADPLAPEVVFETPASETRTAGNRKAPAAETVLRVCGLSHQFRLNRRQTIQAVDNVSFDIHRGEIFALVGESGSGKSTLARCVLGLYRTAGGQIVYNETYIPDRRHIGFIPQDPGAALNSKMNVRDLIAEPLEIQKAFPDRRKLDDRIEALLQEVNLDVHFMDRFPPELSGGQKQRVNIARAFGMDPGLLVADEPLASLDVSIQAQIVELFADLRQRHDTAMLFIAHDLSMVEFLSDRVGVMYRGRLVELAETEELFRSPAHPYTKALLSAIPIPDPAQERGRSVQKYRPDPNGTGADGADDAGDARWIELSEGHFVLGGDRSC